MPSTATVQKLPQGEWTSFDPDFTPEFYRPYEAAVENAFLLLDDARSRLSRESPSCAVRAMTFRLKSPSSIRGKLLKKCLPATAEAAGACLQDVAGLRVVLSSVQAVYRFADLLKASSFAECIEEIDYIAAPKKSGYRSLHLILRVPVCLRGSCLMIPVEIQLRTAGMDIWASIEHEICYKPVK